MLLQEAGRLGIVTEGESADEASAEEATIQALLAHEIVPLEPDEAPCRRYWSANAAKFSTPGAYEAAHIRFPTPQDDITARAAAKQSASEKIALL